MLLLHLQLERQFSVMLCRTLREFLLFLTSDSENDKCCRVKSRAKLRACRVKSMACCRAKSRACGRAKSRISLLGLRLCLFLVELWLGLCLGLARVCLF